MTSSKEVNFDLNSVKQIRSMRRAAGWLPIHQTLTGKILIVLASTVVIGGFCAAVIVPLGIGTANAINEAETSTTLNTTTATTTTPITTTTSVTTTTTFTTSTTTQTMTTTSTPIIALSNFATVTASNFASAAGTPTQQGDGLVNRPNTTGGTYFNSGAYPPQYVQLDLGGEYNITYVCLEVAQSPNGATHHQLDVGVNSTSLTLATDLNSTTYSGEWINITYNPPLTPVRYLQLNTLSSPSWVAWTKFLVYGY